MKQTETFCYFCTWNQKMKENGKRHCYFCTWNQKLKKHIVIFLYGILLRHSWIHWEAGNILWELSTAVCSRLSLDEYGSSLATA